MYNLRNKVLSGIIWETTGRFSSIGIQFLVTVLIARILTPEEFGIIGLLTVFIAFGQILLDSGFSQALIQKKNATETDLSSIFFLNILLGIIIYFIFYFAAPQIAEFYKVPELKIYARVLFLIIPFTSLGLIQYVILQKELDFRKTSIANTVSAIISGFIGVLMAYNGYKIWSLVGQQLSLHIIRSYLYILQRKWIPNFIISKKSIVDLISFSIGLLGHSIVNVLMRNIYILVIGRFFPVAQVGFYTQANKFQEVSASTLAQSVIQVSFPALVIKKDEPSKLKSIYSKMLATTIFFVSPLMFFLIIICEVLFKLILTEKWLPAVPYFQILCVYGMFLPMLQISYNVYKIFRKSKLLLIIDLLRHLLVLISIFATINYGINLMLIFLVFCTFIMVLINLYISGSYISFSFIDQIKTYTPYYIISILISVGVYAMPNTSSDLMTIFYKSIVFIIGYLLISKILQLQGYIEFLKILKTIKSKFS